MTLQRPKVALREKIYLFLTFISLIMLFAGILQIRPIIVEPKAFWGLASYLPLIYWVGLLLLLGVSVCAYLDRGPIRDLTYMILLIAMGFFLFGIAALAFENTRNPDAIWPSSVANVLVQQGHLDITTPPHLTSYYSWPAIHFFTASMLELCGISLSFIKYMPLVFMVILVFLSYGVGKRLALSPKKCFVFGFLLLTSWLFLFHYGPNAIGMLFYMTLFILLLFSRQTPSYSLLCILIFAALIFTHGLSTIAVLLSLVVLSIQRRQLGFLPVFVIMFVGWYMLQAYAAMNAGIQTFWASPFRDIFQAASMEKYQVVSSMARVVSRYSELAYLAIWAIFLFGSISFIIRRKLSISRRKLVLFLFTWIIGVVFVVALAYNGHSINRAYLYVLIPVVLVTTLVFGADRIKRIYLVICMCLTALLFVPANYAGEANWGQVLTSELEGAKYFALSIQPETKYFYNNSGGLINSYNPELSAVRWYKTQTDVNIRSLEDIDITLLRDYQYVILSKQCNDSMVFRYNEDPYSAWPYTSDGMNSDVLYDNGYYFVYLNPEY